MKRKLGAIIATALCFILTAVSVYADDGRSQNPDYVTDYYMIVQSAQGGVDIYDEADPQSVKLNDKQIPNGTAIHVLGEKSGTDNNEWAYTQYHGMNGYVPMGDLNLATRDEAIDKEYNTFGGKDVDFEVKIQGNSVNVPVYNGPGEKFDEVSGSNGIADETTVHISQYVQGEDGTNWGKADTQGVDQGWINLDRDTGYATENAPAAENLPDATGTSGNVPAAADEVTPTPIEAVTPTPEATPTPKATPTPEATPTEKATPTPEATPTEEVTPTPEATPTEEATPTPETVETEKPDSTDEKKASEEQTEKTSGKNVKSDSGMKNPVIWISGIGIILIVILLIYFLKKKK